MLDFINYPVSGILWFWHRVFGYVFDPVSGYAWALSVVFLVFTLRALLFKPFVHQVRSMKKMQEFAPQIRELQNKHGNDRQRMAQEMQKLQSEQGFNPASGCLPMLVQVPVFIGLFQVLNGFKPDAPSNFLFDRAEVVSFVKADLFGANLANTISQSPAVLAEFGTDRMSMILVGVPLMIAAAIATHFTARHSVERQAPDQSSNAQTALMNRMTLWLFPMFALIGGPFLPLAILLYWLANNFWTLAQQRIVFRRIDREEAERAAASPAPSEQAAVEPATVEPATEPAAGHPSAPDTAEPDPASGDREDRPVEAPSGEAPGSTEDHSRDGDSSGRPR